MSLHRPYVYKASGCWWIECLCALSRPVLVASQQVGMDLGAAHVDLACAPTLDHWADSAGRIRELRRTS